MPDHMPPLPDQPSHAPSETAGEDTASLALALQQWVYDARALVGQHMHLLALEAQRAGRALGHIAAFGLAAGLLLAGAWTGMGIACALWLMEQGTRPSMALLACSVLNLLGVLMLMLLIRRSSVALTFSATRRSLQCQPDEPVAP